MGRGKWFNFIESLSVDISTHQPIGAGRTLRGRRPLLSYGQSWADGGNTPPGEARMMSDCYRRRIGGEKSVSRDARFYPPLKQRPAVRALRSRSKDGSKRLAHQFKIDSRLAEVRRETILFGSRSRSRDDSFRLCGVTTETVLSALLLATETIQFGSVACGGDGNETALADSFAAPELRWRQKRKSMIFVFGSGANRVRRRCACNVFCRCCAAARRQ